MSTYVQLADGSQAVQSKQVFREVKTIHGAFNVSTSAISKIIQGDCTVNVISGTVWVNPNTTAVADSTAIQVTGAIDLNVISNLSLISNSTGATVQIIVWK